MRERGGRTVATPIEGVDRATVQVAIERHIDEIAAVSARLLHSLQTTADPKNREEEAVKAKARSAERFGIA